MKLLMENAFFSRHMSNFPKEKEGLECAYEVEQACSVESENSLQELVALLLTTIKELKQHVKHKFSKLKKRRVPLDC